MKKENLDYIEIDILSILKALWGRKFIIIGVTMLFTIISFIYSSFFITPSYRATTRIYIVNQAKTDKITTQDLQLSNYLIKDYKGIILSRDVLRDTIKKAKVGGTGSLYKNANVVIPESTRVISITVADKNPETAKILANTLREVASEKIKKVTKIDDVTVLEEAETPTSPASPNVKRNTIIGFLMGIVLVVSLIVLKETLDDKVKTPEDVEEKLNLTILGIIPNKNSKK